MFNFEYLNVKQMSTQEFNSLVLNNSDGLRPFAITLTKDYEVAKDLCQEKVRVRVRDIGLHAEAQPKAAAVHVEKVRGQVRATKSAWGSNSSKWPGGWSSSTGA